MVNSTVTLEDRTLPGGRTWRSSVVVRVDRLRLYQVDLQAAVTVEGLDLAMGRVYLPAEAPAVVDQGRASTIIFPAEPKELLIGERTS